MESSLREFPNIKPVNFWFEYPLHKVDKTGELEKMFADGDPKNNLKKSPNRTTKESRALKLTTEFNKLFTKNKGKPVDLQDLAFKMELSERSVRRYIENSDGQFAIKNGKVTRTDYEDDDED